MVNYQALPLSPSTDEKTVFLGNEDIVAVRQRPSVGQRIVGRFVRLSVGLLALVGLLQLISFTPLRRFTPDVLNDFARHAKHHGHGKHKMHHPHHGPHHGPGHKGPPPFFHPTPIECFDLSDRKAAVNLSITLPHPGAPLHLSPSLGNADIQLYTDKADKEAELQESPHLPSHPPPHGPHHGPPGRGPPHPPHGRPQMIVVGIERASEPSHVTSRDFTVENKDKEGKNSTTVFVCSLELPFGQIGLGLFHEKPEKHSPPRPSSSSLDKKKEDNEDKPKPPPERESFPPVALTVRHPAGEPFTVTSAMPFFHPPSPPHGHPHPPPHGHPHPPPHKGSHPPPPPPPFNGAEQNPRKGMIIVISTVANKMCGVGRKLMTSISRT